MENEHLRTAITHAGLTLEEFADIVQVDVKTVQRWLAGRTPYPRHRARVAGALDTTEQRALAQRRCRRRPRLPARAANADGDRRRGRGVRICDRPAAPNPVDSCAQRSSGSSSSSPTSDRARTRRPVARRGGRGLPGRASSRTQTDSSNRCSGSTGSSSTPLAAARATSCTGPTSRCCSRFTTSASARPSPLILSASGSDGGLFDRLADEFDDRWHEATPLPTASVFTPTSPSAELSLRPNRSIGPRPTRPAREARRRRGAEPRRRSRRAAGQDDGPDPAPPGEAIRRGALSRSRRDCRACRRPVKVGALEATGAADRPRPLS